LRARAQPRTRAGLRNGAGARAQAGLRIQTSPVGFLARPLSGLIRLSPARREAVEKKLERAGSALCAEDFYADAAVRAIGVSLLAPLCALMGVPTAAVASAALGIGLYYKRIGELDTRLSRIRLEIADELPRFVSVLNYSMSTDRDLIRAIERYKKIAKPAFQYDLALLLLEMKGGNNTEALKRFDARIDIPQLSAFVSGLIDADRGVDQKTFFYLMEENMKQLFIENKKKELSRRPAKIKKAIIAVGMCLFLLYLVPISMQLIEGLRMFQ
jgi:CheY-like chemotaxis protein